MGEGLFGGKTKTPKAPDPYAVSDAQTRSNQDTAAYNASLNRVNTTTPYGTQTFTSAGRDPLTGAPIYNQDIKLNAPQQALLDQQQQQDLAVGNISQNQIGQMANAYSQGIDPSSIGKYRDDAERALYDRNTAYMDRDYQRSEDRERNRLANQGVVEGSEAYKSSMDNFNRDKEIAYRQARNEAIAGGGAEADRSMSQLFALRNQPLNEYNALRNSAQVQMPNFQGPANVSMPGTDVSGNVWNAYQGQVAGANASQASNNAMMGGLFNLGGQLGGAAITRYSDRRLKSDIVQIGELPSGLPVYRYRINGLEQVGVMADEARQMYPEAVSVTKDGLMMVNYAMVH
jgi:hypothetical protein